MRVGVGVTKGEVRAYSSKSFRGIRSVVILQRNKFRETRVMMKTKFWRKGQPHIQPIGACFSITMLVQDAVPRALIEELQCRRKAALIAVKDDDDLLRKSIEIHHTFEMEMEKILNAKNSQEYPFRSSAAAGTVLDEVNRYANKYYEVLAICVMPNHVHMLLDFSVQLPMNWDGKMLLPFYQNVPQVIKRIKGASARLINRRLNRKGALWNKGYYDRFIRDRVHLENERNYILNNALKAGLVKKWSDYPFLYPKY